MTNKPHISKLVTFAGLLALLCGCSYFAATPAAPPADNAQQTTRPVRQAKAPQQTATLAAGCFWSMEAIFSQLDGVISVEPGYAGGSGGEPSYQQVETGTSGFAETVNIIYDPTVITYRDLLRVLLTTRNPTTLNGQDPDYGPQYRSVIFARNQSQAAAARAVIKDIDASHLWRRPIVTAVERLKTFYRAEDYHLDYYRRHPNEPYCKYVIAPEIANFRRTFKDMLK